MKISVVIATFNRRELLARTVEGLAAQDLPPEDFEVVVVVDGSTDGTVEFLARLSAARSLEILEQPNLGQAAALNRGVNAARGDVVLFLDDDILCPSTLLHEHLAARADGQHVVVFGPVRTALQGAPTLAAAWTERRMRDDRRWLTEELEPRWPFVATGRANSSLPRAAFLAAGGFDERLRGARDDTDLGLRLWKMGLGFRYQATAVAYEIYVKSSEAVVRNDARRFGGNEVRVCRKHPEYRPHSALARIHEGALPKRLTRQIAMRLPFSPETLLRPPFRLVERMPRTDPLVGVGVRLLQARMAVVTFRSALSEAGSWDALRAEFGMTLPVLLYHDVGRRNTIPHRLLTVSPAQFERDVRWLSCRGYVGITPSDWIAWRRGTRALPGKPILVTFDDAYAEIADTALPVLRRHGFGAAVFVITGEIGGKTPWDGSPLMTAEQIRYWSRHGIEFGAHTCTHPHLTGLPNAAIAREVEGSARDLANVLGHRVASFAYPHGAYNDAVQSCVRKIFDLAFTTDEGMNGLHSDPYALRRTMVRPGDTSLDLALRGRLGWSPLQRVRAHARVRTRVRGASTRLHRRSRRHRE